MAEKTEGFLHLSIMLNITTTMSRHKNIWAVTLGCLLLMQTGCTSMKAKPATSAGFVRADLLKANNQFPFHYSWIKENTDWKAYKKLYIAPVNTDYLHEMGWWKSLERGPKLEEDLKDIAQFTYDEFVDAFTEDESQRFEILQTFDNEGLIFELALTEIVPSKITLNALGYAPFVGLPAKTLRWFSKSRVAFEARIRDGKTGEVLAIFADREQEKWAPLNVKDLSWYGHARSIIKAWAGQFVEAFQSNLTQDVSDTKPITLKPW